MAVHLKKKKATAGEIPMASMSDIAFLLLIFFLVSTIFAVEKGIFMTLPGKQTTTARVKRKNLMVIQARADNSITVDDQLVTLREVQDITRRRLAENDRLVVVVETHPDAEYGIMVDILDELKQTDARKVALKRTET
jgi:biopolymer transport protein ExbD